MEHQFWPDPNSRPRNHVWAASCCCVLSVCAGCCHQGLYLKLLLKNLLNVQSSVDSFGELSLLQYILQNAWCYLLFNLGMVSVSGFGLGAVPQICILWGLWPGFPAVFDPPPPGYSLPNCSRGGRILSTTAWWMEHISEWKQVPTFLWDTFSHPLSSRCPGMFLCSHFVSKISCSISKYYRHCLLVWTAFPPREQRTPGVGPDCSTQNRSSPVSPSLQCHPLVHLPVNVCPRI